MEPSIPLQKPEPRFERRKDERPAELVAAALELFVEKGFTATRLDDVAARAGVSKGTLYLYFDSKEELFKAVIGEGIVPVIQEAEQLVANHAGTSSDLLHELVHGWWQLFGASKLSGLPKLMISEAKNFPEVARYYYTHVIEPGTRLFACTLERGIASGEFRPVNVDFTVRALIAQLIMRVVWMHSFSPCAGPDIDSRAYLDHTLDLLLTGLRSHAPQPASARSSA